MASNSVGAAQSGAIAGQKRTASAAGINGAPRTVKRRASKACQCCRARKVRCNVVEHGAPCTNCRLDEVECIITESKRRKKIWGPKLDSALNKGGADRIIASVPHHADTTMLFQSSRRYSNDGLAASPASLSVDGNSDKENGSHVPHFIYQAQGLKFNLQENSSQPVVQTPVLAGLSSLASASPPSYFSQQTFPSPTRQFTPPKLPKFIKPIPSRISTEDLAFLCRKGSLTLPPDSLMHDLLRSYFDYVHPFMPLLDEEEFIHIFRTGEQLEKKDGVRIEGRISLLLFQSVMFVATSFARLDMIQAAGYATRKACRKAFFQKARALYDFDIEQDRICLVQSLLLMSYWYETPDDQKDTWHWMGVATSLAHTIGLHRNPAKSSMEERRQKLWKRIWWCCFMRDRLVALGMRRPTRIKSEDCDVPMLEMEDFDFNFRSNFDPDLSEVSEKNKRRLLAMLVIEKAKLSLCISNVLTAQYSVLNIDNLLSRTPDAAPTKSSMLLLPKRATGEGNEVEVCDEELNHWEDRISEELKYRPAAEVADSVDESVLLHRNLLHMFYYTAVSALHRPQVLPSAPAPWPARNKCATLQELSRKKVRKAASEITKLGEELLEFDLVRYLPTTGVTVLLPAVIIHLLDIKSSSQTVRELSTRGFALCMQVMQGLRESYSAADFATHFLEAAVKKADIQVPRTRSSHSSSRKNQRRATMPDLTVYKKDKRIRTSSSSMLMQQTLTLTPPPEAIEELTDEDDLMQDNFDALLSDHISSSASTQTTSEPTLTPLPSSRSSSSSAFATLLDGTPGALGVTGNPDADREALDAFLADYTDPFLPEGGDSLSLADVGHGESGSLGLDMPWMNMKAGSAMAEIELSKLLDLGSGINSVLSSSGEAHASLGFDLDDVIQGL